MTARSTHCFLAVLAALSIGACDGAGPTMPAMIGDASAVYSRSGDDPVVLVLRRNHPLRRDLRTSDIIGPAGGSLTIPEAGVTVTFAPGAVKSRTRISVTAASGSGVAYEFEPHGLVFAAPVTVRQSLVGTAAEHDRKLAAALQGSYYDSDLAKVYADAGRTHAHIRERRAGRFHSDRDVLEFTVEHFSGYMVSTGFTGGVSVRGLD